MADALSPGMVVAGTFEVERLIGRGGMGEVWLGRHQRLSGKQVAIKVLHTQGPLPAEALARFKREAEIAVRLEHPNIVQVLDFNSLPSGQPFIVMELLKGESLSARLKHGPMSPDETSMVMRQVGSALHAAHAAGVVHRDLKPENIFLVPTGLGDQAKVLDFGISKLSDGGTMQTTDSVLMGTPLYMSPEQALGHNRDVTPQSDVFSLGSIVYECLSGKAPFEADNIAKVVFRIAYEPHVPLLSLAPHVPATMANAVEHALQKDRANRTINVAAFVLELTGQVLSGNAQHPSSMPTGPTGVLSPGARVDEQMMAGATVAPSSNILPKAPVLATPNPASVVTPKAPEPQAVTPSPEPPKRSAAMLIGGGLLVVAIGVGTFVAATKVDPGQTVVVVDAGAPVVTPPLVVVIDAGAPVDAEVDAGAVVAAVDAGAAPTVKLPGRALTPPSGSDLAELNKLEAQLKVGEWEDVWSRRGSLVSRLTSQEGQRDFFILMIEVACQRGDLSNANIYARRLENFPAAAKDLARKRCRKHRDWSL
ncbi:MAG: serine/threonine-protein kinase [Myxococcales bacterium]|nr:serine/threonine-protein kinase [Myxococcales bacterium]